MSAGGSAALGSPNALEVLLHSYYASEPHPRHDAPAVIQDRKHLFLNGMVDREDEFCRCTDKGKFFIKHLLKIPFPEPTHFIPVRDCGEAA